MGKVQLEKKKEEIKCMFQIRQYCIIPNIVIYLLANPVKYLQHLFFPVITDNCEGWQNIGLELGSKPVASP